MTERILTVKEVNSAAAQLCGSAFSCSSRPSPHPRSSVHFLRAVVNEY